MGVLCSSPNKDKKNMQKKNLPIKKNKLSCSLLCKKILNCVGIMTHYWNGGYTIGMVTILLKMWLTIEKVAQLLEWWLRY